MDEILSASTITDLDVQELGMDASITLESSTGVAFESPIESTHQNSQKKGKYTHIHISFNHEYM